MVKSMHAEQAHLEHGEEGLEEGVEVPVLPRRVREEVHTDDGIDHGDEPEENEGVAHGDYGDRQGRQDVLQALESPEQL